MKRKLIRLEKMFGGSANFLEQMKLKAKSIYSIDFYAIARELNVKPMLLDRYWNEIIGSEQDNF